MNRDKSDFLGKRVVVTGSSSGIGRCIALTFAGHGARVVVHGATRSARLRETMAAMEAIGAESAAIDCDLSHVELLETFVKNCWQTWGGVDIWVNNAGSDILTGSGPELTFDDKLQRLWAVDIRATLTLSRLVGRNMYDVAADENCLPTMVNIGWDQAVHGMAGDSGLLFGTVKGAVMAMTGHLAHTFAPRVRVNCVAPGWIKTDWGEAAPEHWAKRACDEALLNRWGSVDDVAQAVLMLASPSSQFINGQVIPVNGGFRFGPVGDGSFEATAQ